MLYQIIQTKAGKEYIKMIDSLKKCNNRLKELRNSFKGKNVSFRIEKSEHTEKFEATPIGYPWRDNGSNPPVIRKKK